MTIFYPNYHLNKIGPRSRSQLLFLEKLYFHHTINHTFLYCSCLHLRSANVNYDNIWGKLAFQPCWAKIKVTVARGGAFITLSDFLVIYLFIFELWPIEILSF